MKPNRLRIFTAVCGAALLAAGLTARADEPEGLTPGADLPESAVTADAPLALPPLDFDAVDTVVVEIADSTAADFFVHAPSAILPTIDEMTRLDMIDYFDAGSDKPSRNVLGGECRVIAKEPMKIVFTTSPVSEYMLALLPAPGKEDKKIIMLSRTLKTPADDSTVKFYDTNWKELTGLFTVPTLDQWITPEGNRRRADVENAVPFVLARLEYSPSDRVLTFTNNLPDYIPQEMLELATGSVHRSLRYRWTGKKFEKIK